MGIENLNTKHFELNLVAITRLIRLLQKPYQFQMFLSISKGEKKIRKKYAKLRPHELGYGS